MFHKHIVIWKVEKVIIIACTYPSIHTNIIRFQRYGRDFNSFTGDCLTDDLAYLYSGNQVQQITNRALPLDETEETDDDPGTEYCFSYDSNGRITDDGHQGLEIRYNLLNLLCYLYDTDAMSELDCTYLYDGSKYDVSSPEGLYYHYRGNFIYCGDDSWGSTPSLESVDTPEGRLLIDGDSIHDLWYAKDYLGNVRTVVDLDSGILEENDYLPFGTKIQDYTQARMDSNRWRYAGKEELSPLVSENCHLIDFGARAYDPWSARWTSIDPMAHKYAGMTPYNYCANAPILYIDNHGDSLFVSNPSFLTILYNGVPQGANISFQLINGRLDPDSFETNGDFFLEDLKYLASRPDYIELSSVEKYKIQKVNNGDVRNIEFITPFDGDENDVLPEDAISSLKAQGFSVGKTIIGNLGRALFPNSTESISPDKKIHIYINAKGSLNAQTVGLSHEFGHVVLYLLGRPYQHPEADTEIYIRRANKMLTRLGYDY